MWVSTQTEPLPLQPVLVKCEDGEEVYFCKAYYNRFDHAWHDHNGNEVTNVKAWRVEG